MRGLTSDVNYGRPPANQRSFALAFVLRGVEFPHLGWTRTGSICRPGRVTGLILRNLCRSSRVAGQPKFTEICFENIESVHVRNGVYG